MGGLTIAAQAAALFPELPQWYGQQCQLMGDAVPMEWEDGRLILFPTRERNNAKPHLSWRSYVSSRLIKFGLTELVRMMPKLLGGKIMLPILGCTETDGFPMAMMMPLLMEAVEAQPRIILVRTPGVYEVTQPSRRREKITQDERRPRIST